MIEVSRRRSARLGVLLSFAMATGAVACAPTVSGEGTGDGRNSGTSSSSGASASSSGSSGARSSSGGSSSSGSSSGTTSSSGGSSSSGSSSGASSSSGGSTSSSGSSACGKALACDDFEAQSPGAAPGSPWIRSVSIAGGTVTIDATRARSGSRSVKIYLPAASGYRSALLGLQAPTLPVSPNVVYGRMMFFLESAPTSDVHWTFIDGYGLVPGKNYHAVYRYGGQHPVSGGSQLMANYETPDSYNSVGPSTDCWQHANGKVVPVGRWACVEWGFDGTANTMRLWLDGQELTDLTMSGTGQGCGGQSASFPWTAPTFERIDVGWESYQADQARTLWIDDLAIGTERIGCP